MFKEILKLFLVWRLILIIVAYFGAGRFPQIPNGGPGAVSVNSQLDFFKSWAQWDGGHYVGIAQNGYAHLFQHAFFPLYPILIKLVSIFTFGNYFLSAYIISSLSTVALLYVFYRLIRLKFNQEIAWRSLFYFLIFPSSVFLAAAYSESIFILLSLLSFYFANQKKWFAASLFTGLTTATKFAGILIIPVLIFIYLEQKKFSLKKIKLDIAWLFTLAPLGLVSYMYYLFSKTGDYLYFLRAQEVWKRSTFIVNPVEVLINYTQNTIILFNHNLSFFVQIATDYFPAVFFLIASFLVFQKISKSLGIYSFLVAILPILTGTLLSMPRLVLISFPVFILLGIWGGNKTVDLIITLFSLMFLALFTVLFINGNWIA